MMKTNNSRKGLYIVGLVAVLAMLAGLACARDVESLFDGTTSGDDAAGPSDGSGVGDSPTATATTMISIPPGPTPTEDPPGGDGVFERAFYDPAADLGPPDEHDAFDGSNPLFFERTHANSAAWYGTDERYHITYTFLDKWVWYWANVYGIDFYADVVVINSDQCVDGDSGGLIFRGRLDIDAGYMFGVTCGGSYFVGATIIPGSAGLICWIGNGTNTNCDPGAAANSVVPSEFINAGPGAANRLGVMADGTMRTYFINGHQVESITRPADIFYEGHFTLYLGTGQENTAEAIFDDFSVWHTP